VWHQLLHRFDAAAQLLVATTDEEGCRHAAPNLTGVAFDLTAVGHQAFAPGPVSRGGDDPWHIPLIGVARHDPQHAALTRGADEHRDARSLHGFGAWIGTCKLIVA